MSTDVESSTVQIGIVEGQVDVNSSKRTRGGGTVQIGIDEGQVDVNSSKRTRGRGKKWHVYPQKKFDNPQVKFFSKYMMGVLYMKPGSNSTRYRAYRCPCGNLQVKVDINNGSVLTTMDHCLCTDMNDEFLNFVKNVEINRTELPLFQGGELCKGDKPCKGIIWSGQNAGEICGRYKCDLHMRAESHLHQEASNVDHGVEVTAETLSSIRG